VRGLLAAGQALAAARTQLAKPQAAASFPPADRARILQSVAEQEANLRKQKEPIAEVITHLTGLRDSWAEMLRRGTGSDLVPVSHQAEHRLQAA